MPKYRRRFTLNFKDSRFKDVQFEAKLCQFSTSSYRGLFISYGTRLISLVRFTYTYRNQQVRFYIPYYRSTGANSGLPGAWFPFSGVCSLKPEHHQDIYTLSYCSQRGTRLIKMSEAIAEPFSRDRGLNQSSLVNDHSLSKRWGNLIHLLVSYTLFTIPFTSKRMKRNIKSILSSIKSLKRRVSELHRFKDKDIPNIRDPLKLNKILERHTVVMPYNKIGVEWDECRIHSLFRNQYKLNISWGEYMLEPNSNTKDEVKHLAKRVKQSRSAKHYRVFAR